MGTDRHANRSSHRQKLSHQIHDDANKPLAAGTGISSGLDALWATRPNAEPPRHQADRRAARPIRGNPETGPWQTDRRSIRNGAAESLAEYALGTDDRSPI